MTRVSERVALAQKIEELEQPKATERMEAGVTLGSADPRVPKAMPGERGPRVGAGVLLCGRGAARGGRDSVTALTTSPQRPAALHRWRWLCQPDLAPG